MCVPSKSWSQKILVEKSKIRRRQMWGIIALLLGLSAAPVLARNDSVLAARTEAGMQYLVQRDETLSGIAARFTGRTSNWREIGRLNHIDNDRTIPIGTKILIPVRLLPSEPVTARIASFVGNVLIQSHHGKNVEIKVGELVREGDRLTTFQNSFLSLNLDDGTRITLRPETSAVLRRLRVTRHVNKPTTQLFLERGRIDSYVPTTSDNIRPSYEVVSPIAVSSVRGTAFRVGVDEQRSLNETISGTVAVSDGMRKMQRLVSKGFGTVIEDGHVGAPLKLLETPSLKDGYQQQEKLPVQFSLSHKNAAVFHVLISKDQSGAEIMQAAQAVATDGDATVKLADLPDGSYFVHYSAEDTSGLQGLPGVTSFRLKARPFPPLVLQREHKFQGDQPGEDIAVTMEWSQQEGVSAYRLQIAQDSSFASPLFDQRTSDNTSRHEVKLRPGVYYWRIASITTKDGKPDQGPFGGPYRLEVLACQRAPAVEQTETETRFRWTGNPGEKYVFQLSGSPTFDKLFVNLNVDSPMASVSGLEPGNYYARVRSVHSDGFVGVFSPPQKFNVPLRWRSMYGDTWHTGAGAVGVGSER